MKDKDDLRSHSPFEALLAVSGNLGAAETSRSSGQGRASRNLCKADYPVAEQSEMDSADNTALGGAYAEGVATSGGGESGDTDFQSESSRDFQISDDTRADMSESQGGKGPAESSQSRAASAKKQRMVWTVELHKRFLNAVNHLGMDKAVPKVILKMMNVDGMTRENVASHLQKYRLHLRHQAGNQEPRSIGAVYEQPDESPSCGPTRLSGSNQLASRVPFNLSNSLPHAPPPVTGSIALGLPLGSQLTPYQVAGSLVTGAPCEHIPPRAWELGIPGYDALQKLNQVPEEQKVTLLKDLTAPRPLPEGFNVARRSLQTQKTPLLDIAPLSTAPATAPAKAPAADAK